MYHMKELLKLYILTFYNFSIAHLVLIDVQMMTYIQASKLVPVTGHWPAIL